MKVQKRTKVTDIEKVHRDLCRRISAVVGFPGALSIVSAPQGQWHKAACSARVRFTLARSNRRLSFDTAFSDLGSKQNVMKVIESDDLSDTLWAHWGEEWCSLGNDLFDLVGVGWTFYVGVYARPEKTQLVRAEWDNPPQRGQSAPQPHWHVDAPAPYIVNDPFVYSFDNDPVASESLQEITSTQSYGTGLEELSPTSEVALRLGKLHLGMGCWNNQSGHPARWQRIIDPECSGLAEWAESSLVLFREEFERSL